MIVKTVSSTIALFYSLHAGYFFMPLMSFANFFSKLTFSKNSFRNTIRVPINLGPDQDKRSVDPDLGPNCLQLL